LCFTGGGFFCLFFGLSWSAAEIADTPARKINPIAATRRPVCLQFIIILFGYFCIFCIVHAFSSKIQHVSMFCSLHLYRQAQPVPAPTPVPCSTLRFRAMQGARPRNICQ